MSQPMTMLAISGMCGIPGGIHQANASVVCVEAKLQFAHDVHDATFVRSCAMLDRMSC